MEAMDTERVQYPIRMADGYRIVIAVQISATDQSRRTIEEYFIGRNTACSVIAVLMGEVFKEV